MAGSTFSSSGSVGTVRDRAKWRHLSFLPSYLKLRKLHICVITGSNCAQSALGNEMVAGKWSEWTSSDFVALVKTDLEQLRGHVAVLGRAFNEKKKACVAVTWGFL